MKKNIGRMLLFLAVSLLGMAGCGFKSNPAAEQAAREAAQTWLNLADQGKYAETWDTAAGMFRSSIGRDAWQGRLRAARQPLGKVVSREIKSSRYATSLPGVPDGGYVVIQYRTSFEHKKASLETITPMLDQDGRWRVSGYYIR